MVESKQKELKHIKVCVRLSAKAGFTGSMLDASYLYSKGSTPIIMAGQPTPPHWGVPFDHQTFQVIT